MTVGLNNWIQRSDINKFIVKNIAPKGKCIRIFQYPIDNGSTFDLMTIPFIAEADIRLSLLKGELYLRLKNKEIEIVESDVDLLQFNDGQKEFLKQSGITKGIDVADSVRQTYELAWSVYDWYLDGTNGNDENDGTSTETALKTGMGLAEKLGPNIEWYHDVTIHVLSSIEDGIFLNWVEIVPIHLQILGVPTVLVRDTMKNFVHYNYLTNVPSNFTANTITDFTPYIGKRIRNSNGLTVNGTSWIGEVNFNGQGVDRAIANYWLNSDVNNVYGNAPITGQEFVIEELPIVPSLVLNGSHLMETDPNNYSGFEIRHLEINNANVTVPASEIWGNRVQGCYFNGKANFTGMENSIEFNTCAFRLDQVSFGGYFVAIVFFRGSLFPDVSITGNSQSCVFQGITGHGCGFWISRSCSISDLWVFDAENAMTINSGNTVTNFAHISGQRNSGYGIALDKNSSYIHIQKAMTPTLTGNAGNIYLMPEDKVIGWTIPFKDGAYSGTTTLTSGSKTINVAYLNTSTQQILATYNTPGSNGTTPLSIPSASRTASSFIINNGQATDSTSTVDWQVTSQGNGIFIL